MGRAKYQPSNGTEGEWFMNNHCYQCIHCDPDPDGEKQCEILARALFCKIDSKEYPKEWTYLDGKPTCTEWVKWDWNEGGNPDNNPKAPIEPNNPNQLMLISIADNILRTKDNIEV